MATLLEVAHAGVDALYDDDGRKMADVEALLVRALSALADAERALDEANHRADYYADKLNEQRMAP